MGMVPELAYAVLGCARIGAIHSVIFGGFSAQSIAKFNERKRRGEIPANARPGAGIGIHGVWPHEDFVVDRYKNWTNGCVSLKNGDVEDLYRYIPVGTPVTIRK